MENNIPSATHQEKAKKMKKLRRWQIAVSLLGEMCIRDRDDTLLEEMGLPKGSMQLIDDAKLQQINTRFSQMKNNMNYKRFRHFGKDKVFMDFSFFAIAFNIKKMCVKVTKEGMDWLIRPFYELTVALF